MVLCGVLHEEGCFPARNPAHDQLFVVLVLIILTDGSKVGADVHLLS